MATSNLWPPEITQDIGLTGPAAILREQAVLLGEQTKNLVKGLVVPQRDLALLRNDNAFVDQFVIEGPVIDYMYVLFTVRYPIDFYPAQINVDLPGITGGFVQNEEEFIAALEKIFANQKTIKIIQAIITRSKQGIPDYVVPIEEASDEA